LRSGEGVVFNNTASGIFEIQKNAFFSGVGVGGIEGKFINAGTVMKRDSTGTATLGVNFSNTGGTVEVRSGTLSLSLGGKSTGGVFNVASGATLNLGGTHVLSGAYSGLADGSFPFSTLQINSSGATFNFGGRGFDWNTGTITGPGTLINTGNFIISGSIKFLRGGATINNASAIAFSTTDLRSGEGAVFNNLTGATFDIQGNAFFSGNTVGGAQANFNNAGTVIKSTGTSTATLQINFANAGGTITVQSGTLALSLGGKNTGGIFNVASGASLSFGGTHIFSGDFSGLADGSFPFNIIQIDSSGANFNFTSSAFNWSTGTITGPGILTNTGNFSITGTSIKFLRGGARFNNAGTVAFSATDLRAGEGAVFNNLSGGSFDIQGNAFFSGNLVGGTQATFNNAGTAIRSTGTGTATMQITFTSTGTVDIKTGILSFSLGYTQQTSSSNVGITISGINAGTGFGQHRTTGGITRLAGNLNVSLNNFTPAVGNSFQVMTFVNRNNTQFANINLPALPPGLVWAQPAYTTTSLTLSVVAGGAER
jgi:hypothetical protein